MNMTEFMNTFVHTLTCHSCSDAKEGNKNIIKYIYNDIFSHANGIHSLQ